MTRSARIGSGLVVLLLTVAGCGDDTSGDREGFCAINADLEGYFPLDAFPPEAARREAEEPRIAMALRAPLVLFDAEDVVSFADGLDELLSVAPGEIRDSVQTLSDSFQAVFNHFRAIETGAIPPDLTAQLLEEEVFGGESDAAGFALEEWIDSNCSS